MKFKKGDTIQVVHIFKNKIESYKGFFRYSDNFFGEIGTITRNLKGEKNFFDMHIKGPVLACRFVLVEKRTTYLKKYGF